MTDVVRWFTRGAHDHRPRLCCLGAVDEAWQLDVGLVLHAHGHLWLPVGDQIAAVKVQGPIRATVSGDRWLGTDAAGRTVRRTAAHLELLGPSDSLRGWTTTLTRAAHRWQSEPALPLGAALARRIEPLPTEAGVVWADGGWLYLRRGDRPAQPCGAIRDEEVLRAGPNAAVLIGERDGETVRWTRLCRPDQPSVPLHPPVADAGLRWSPDGASLSWLDPDDERPQPWCTDTTTGLGRRGEATGHPTGGPALLADDGSLSPPSPHDLGARGALPPVLGPKARTLGGPGAQVWDLERGEPCAGPLGPGFLLPPDRARGAWSQLAADGTLYDLGDPDPVPLASLPAGFVSGWRSSRSHLLLDEHGETWRLGPRHLTHLGDPPARPSTRHERSHPAWRALTPWCVLRDGVAYAWNAQGLLLAFPEPATVRSERAITPP